MEILTEEEPALMERIILDILGFLLGGERPRGEILSDIGEGRCVGVRFIKDLFSHHLKRKACPSVPLHQLSPDDDSKGH